MKRFTFLVSFSLLTFCTKAQTTTEIYNYITKGYITTISQGLDMKKGYAYKDLLEGAEFEGSLSTSKYQFVYRKFYEEKNPDETVAFMILLKKNGTVAAVFCMPSAKSAEKLWSLFFKDITARLYADQKNQMLSEIAMLFSAAFYAAEECEKK
jgi:hypothetical protein